MRFRVAPAAPEHLRKVSSDQAFETDSGRVIVDAEVEIRSRWRPMVKDRRVGELYEVGRVVEICQPSTKCLG